MDGIEERYERLGVDRWLTPEDEARARRIFHLHDDPAECDEPELHYGSQDVRLSIEQVDAYVRELRQVAAVLIGREGLASTARDVDEIADALHGAVEDALGGEEEGK